MEMEMAIVRREEPRRQRIQRPHPLAGRTGTGPPIAPPEWRWRAGRRVSDMCFYSPIGQAFRSQINLQKYLAETPSSPPLALFRFNIAADDFKDNSLPGVPLPVNEVCKNRQRCHETDSLLMNKRRKLKLHTEVKPIKDAIRCLDGNAKIEDASQNLTVQSSVTSAAHISGKEGLDIVSTDLFPSKFKSGGKYRYKRGYSFLRILSSLTSYVVLWKNANIMQKFLDDASRLKEKSECELEELRMHLHRRKLSYSNLSKYPEGALRAFVFLLRNQDAPPSLGKEELLDLCSKWRCKKKHYWCFSETQHMHDLAIVKSKAGESFQECINVQHSAQALTALESQMLALKDKSGELGASSRHTRDGIVLGFEKERDRDDLSVPVNADQPDAGELSHEKSSSTNKRNKSIGAQIVGKDSAIEELYESYAQATYTTLFGEEYPIYGQDLRCSSGIYACASTTKNAQSHNNDISYGILSQVDGEGQVLKSLHGPISGIGVLNHIEMQMGNLQRNPEQGLQIATENIIHNPAEQKVADDPASNALCLDPVHPVRYCERAVLQQLPETACENFLGQQSVALYTPHLSDEEGKSTLDVYTKDQKLVSSKKGDVQKVDDSCWCDACSVDPTFCFGCQCSLCKAVISPDQNWSFLHCSGCNHVCHLECALKGRKAGVIKEMGLDGEFLCPSCLRKCDLIPFWKERVKTALMYADISVLEKQLFAAVLVLNGTQREMYQSIHEKVRELHSSILYNKACPELTKLLGQIQKDVDALDDPNAQNDDFDEVSEYLLERFTATDLLEEENKVLECKKKTELDHAEWVQAEKAAATQRLNLQDAIEQTKKMEDEAKARADCARASKKHLQRANARLQFLKSNCKAQIISKEQIEKYRAVLNIELLELKCLQDRVGSYSYDSPKSTVDDLSMLLEGIKLQKKRIEFAQAMFEHMLELNKLFN